MTVSPYKKRELAHKTLIQGEHHVKMEAETRVIHLQTRKHQRLLANHWIRREAWNRFPFTALGNNQPSLPLILDI